MSGISYTESYIIGTCLEGFFFGLYSGIFVIYVQYETSKRGSHKMNNIIFYALCALYILTVGTLVLDSSVFFTLELITLHHLFFLEQAVTGFCDFIAQFILIYRCWIVWGRTIYVAIIPSILAFIFLGTWLAIEGSAYVVGFQGMLLNTQQAVVLALSSTVVSLIVNALVTGLIVFKISKVYYEVKPILGNRDFGITGGRKLRSIMFIIIESGIALFAVQLFQIVLYILYTKEESMLALKVYSIVIGGRLMLNGITPTIIIVRVAMGLSFYDKESMIETITGSLRFAPENPNINPESGRISTEHHESRDESDDLDARLRNGSNTYTNGRPMNI